MKTLLRLGFDIEWHESPCPNVDYETGVHVRRHIVVLGEVEREARYQALAGATGGSFLSAKTFDPREPRAAAFLEAVGASGGRDRRDRQRRYERDVKSGKAERLEWYRALPEK